MTDDREGLRARLIELEGAMRSLDPTGDEYWRRKPERDELRAYDDEPRGFVSVFDAGELEAVARLDPALGRRVLRELAGLLARETVPGSVLAYVGGLVFAVHSAFEEDEAYVATLDEALCGAVAEHEFEGGVRLTLASELLPGTRETAARFDGV